MTSRQFEKYQPIIDETAYIDPQALIIGQVTIGADSSIWPMAVVRGDMLPITIGRRTSIQDGSILHITHASEFNPQGYPLQIGDEVTVGHRVTLHGCIVHNQCLIGMSSTIMDGAVIHSHVILGANSLVPPGKELESGYLWVGSPAKKIRPLTESELKFLSYSAETYVKLKNRYLLSART